MLERVVCQQISKRKFGLNCLLKRNEVNVIFGQVLTELHATSPVPASADIPEEISHQMILLRRRTPGEETALATRFLVGIRLEEGRSEATPASAPSLGKA